MHIKLEQKNHKRGTLLAPNVYKRIKRRYTIITSLQEETVKLQNKLSLTQTKAKEIKQKIQEPECSITLLYKFKSKRDKHF